METLLVGLLAVFLLPVVLVGGVIASIWLIFLSPLIVAGWFIYWLLRKDGMESWRKYIPKWEAKPRKPRKPIMVKWDGKEVPLGVLIFSTIASIFLVVLLVFAILFWIPLWISILIIGFMVGKSIGKRC